MLSPKLIKYPVPPRRSLEVEGDRCHEELIESAARDAAAPDELHAAFLGEDADPGARPPPVALCVPRRAAAQRERLVDEDLEAAGDLALHVVQVGQIGLVVDGDVPVGVG